MTTIFVFDTAMIRIFGWIYYPKLISEKVEFNCKDQLSRSDLNIYAPSALAVPMSCMMVTR